MATIPVTPWLHFYLSALVVFFFLKKRTLLCRTAPIWDPYIPPHAIEVNYVFLARVTEDTPVQTCAFRTDSVAAN